LGVPSKGKDGLTYILNGQDIARASSMSIFACGSDEDFDAEIKMKQTAIEAIIPSMLLNKNRSEILRT